MPQGFTLNLTLPEFSSPFAALWWLFTHGGFVAVVIAIGYGIWWLYMDAIQTRWANRQQYILLAIDVPKENEQTPKAVEHIFSHIHGMQSAINLKNKYIEGVLQPTISFELVSIGGYIQYLIRTPAKHRDLVESAIYAQYPQAEISEVEDYVNDFKPVFPNEEYDIWGAELALSNKEAYPIRTYPLWEHSLTQTFLDPMASLLETFGHLREGEQIWMQWVLVPTLDNAWRKRGLDLINKLIGAKVKKKSSLLSTVVESPANLALGTYQTLTRTLFEPGETSRSRDDNSPPSLMQHLPPNIKVEVEAIGMKISKLGYETKARVIYLGRKDIYDSSRINSVFGAMKQYASLDMNGLKPGKMKTRVDYFFVKRREAALKRKIMLSYKYRNPVAGRARYMLNIEELASLWHFPVITVKAPLVKKTDAKRGEPPVSLPVGEMPDRQTRSVVPQTATAGGVRGGAPTNLPLG